METKLKLSQFSHGQSCKTKIAYSKKRDLKMPKLLPWEKKYQHTMFDFLKKDQNTSENKNKCLKSDILCKKLKSPKNDSENKSSTENLPVPLIERNPNCALRVNFVSQKSENNENLPVMQCQSKDVDSKSSEFRINRNYENITNKYKCVEYHMYDIPLELQSKSYITSAHRSPSVKSFSNMFEIGSLRYRIEDLDELFSLPGRNK